MIEFGSSLNNTVFVLLDAAHDTDVCEERCWSQVNAGVVLQRYVSVPLPVNDVIIERIYLIKTCIVFYLKI